MTSPLQIGVIGTGGMGGRHARNLARHTPNAVVTAVMDLDVEAAQLVADECGGATVYSAADALISDPDVAAVVIASPDQTHAGLAHACVVAGKPVLCEKPLATSAAEARAVMEAEVETGKRLIQLGFMREFDDAHRQVYAAVASGALGRPLYFRGTHTNLSEGSPRTIEHVIISSAIHDIHSARWLLGGRVREVFSRYATVPGAGADSCRFSLTELHFDDGKMALVEVNPDAGYGYEVRIEVMCEEGTVSSDGLDNLHSRTAGQAGRPVVADWLERFDQAYRTEAQVWVEAVRQGRSVGPSAWDGYISLVIADACIESARSGLPQPVPDEEMPALYN